MRLSTWIAAITAATFVAVPASAGFITGTYAKVEIDNKTGFDGSAPAYATYNYSSYKGTGSGIAIARIDPLTEHLELGAFTTVDGAAFEADATAHWRDTIRLAGPDPVDSLTLIFEVSGSFSAYDSSFSAMTLGNGSATVGGGRTPSADFNPKWLSASFTQLSPNSYGFHGEYARTVDLTDGRGQFGITLSTRSFLFTRGGRTTAGFGHTATLSRVTLADGNPLPSGLSVTFDSGLVPTGGAAAVPEPASLTLCGITAVLVLGGLRLRRTADGGPARSGRFW